MNLHRYWSSACQQCTLKAKCTPSSERRVSRWEHEDILDTMQTCLDRAPDSMRIRRQTVEHPFGTLKAWMGSTHFLTKTLDRVSTEMSLHVLAYNLKRVMNPNYPLAACSQSRYHWRSRGVGPKPREPGSFSTGNGEHKPVLAGIFAPGTTDGQHQAMQSG